MNGGDPSLGQLVRKLADDGRALIHQEITLVKTEVRDNVRTIAKDAAMLVVGGAVLAVGLLVLLAFAVIGLGVLLGDNYWLSTLIIGAAFCAVGAILLLSGGKGLKEDDLTPRQTAASLRQDREWAQTELRDVRRDLGS